MKAGDDLPGLRTIGSLSLCRTLLAAGLVDRFRVVVFPVITGSTGAERIYDEDSQSAWRWWTAGRSTAGSSSSSTCRRSSPDLPTGAARTRRAGPSG